jgi:F0F1-type ATP synthase membrane subunit b/b'
VGAVSDQQIYDLLLEISDDLADINASADELLLNMRMFNQELGAGRRQLAEARALAQRRILLK